MTYHKKPELSLSFCRKGSVNLDGTWAPGLEKYRDIGSVCRAVNSPG